MTAASAGALRARTLSRPIALGLAAGFLSGLFGVGGGILVVPGLVMLLAMDQRRAHGTSLAAIIPIALSGVAGFASAGKVDWPVALCLVAGAAAGAVVGTHALHVLPQRALGFAFAAILLATAVRLFVDVPDADGRADLSAGSVVALVVLGVVSGVLSGLLGVGGGIVMVPAQVLLFGIPDAVAKGTSLAVIIPTAIVGTRRNLQRGNADSRVAIAVGLSGVASAFAASQISVDLDPELSSVLFALLLSFVALRMLVTLWRGRNSEDDAAR